VRNLSVATAVESAATMESTATANCCAAAETAYWPTCHSATSEATDWTARRVAASCHYWPTTSESAIAWSTIESGATVVTSATVEAVEPRAGSNEDAAREPARAVVAIRRARIRVIWVVAVSADRSGTVSRANSNSDSDADSYLRVRVRCSDQKNAKHCQNSKSL
jgi:hypothetical protein